MRVFGRRAQPLVLGADVVAVDHQRDVDGRHESNGRQFVLRREAPLDELQEPPAAAVRVLHQLRLVLRPGHAGADAALARGRRGRRDGGDLEDAARQGPAARLRRGEVQQELEGHDVRAPLEPPVQRIVRQPRGLREALARRQHADQIWHRERRVEAVDGRERADIGVALEDVLVPRLCKLALELRDDGRAAVELRGIVGRGEQALRELQKAPASFALGNEQLRRPWRHRRP